MLASLYEPLTERDQRPLKFVANRLHFNLGTALAEEPPPRREPLEYQSAAYRS